MAGQKEPLHRTKWELEAAERALEAMRLAETRKDFHEAWQSFLDRLEKVWKMAERECQSFRQRFEPFQGRYKKLRRDDELLAYLAHARNADQHTLQMISAFCAVGFQIEIPPGGKVEIKLDKQAGQLQIRGAKKADSLPPSFVLFPFRDSDVQYNPPKNHLGSTLDENGPLPVAEKALEFYRAFVQEIEAKFLSAGSDKAGGDLR